MEKGDVIDAVDGEPVIRSDCPAVDDKYGSDTSTTGIRGNTKNPTMAREDKNKEMHT
jgi:hypothetical protein